jgi:hypothetical protein
MSNGIPSNSYSRINAYRQASQPQEVQPRPEVAAARPPAAPQQARAANGLSQAEQQMIDRYFPASPGLSLRLYGADRSAQQVNPNGVGSRLDLRG